MARWQHRRSCEIHPCLNAVSRSAGPSRLCVDCAGRLTAWLIALPGIYAELEEILAMPLQRGERVSRSATPSIPLNEQAVRARSRIVGVLASWADLVADEHAVPPPRRAVRDMSHFLVHHARWLAAHLAATDLFGEIYDLVRKGQQAIALGRIGIVDLGPCVVPGCPGELTALLQPAGAVRPSCVRCSQDAGHTWSPAQWQGLHRQRSQLVREGTRGLRASDIASVWRISVGTVYSLASEHGWRRRRDGSRVCYSVSDVFETMTSRYPAGPAAAGACRGRAIAPAPAASCLSDGRRWAG